MLMPARSKFKKEHKGRMKGSSQAGNKLNFGTIGLMVTDRGWMNSKQLEAGRIIINRKIKRNGKLWVNIFPNKPVTKKPLEVRMGKGKGPVEFHVFVVKPGRIIYEITGINHKEANLALKLASNKLPFKTKIIFRN